MAVPGIREYPFIVAASGEEKCPLVRGQKELPPWSAGLRDSHPAQRIMGKVFTRLFEKATPGSACGAGNRERG